MRTDYFTAELRSNAVLSESAATTGGHTTLDYLPGSVFLGHCAWQLYSSLGDKAYNVFHKGAVRFCNAYPLNRNKRPMIPIPLSWHQAKGVEFWNLSNEGDASRYINSYKIVNLTRLKWKDQMSGASQPKQIRKGYFCADGEYILPGKAFHLKTAIDREEGGRPKEAQLFGYEHLCAGSDFYFRVEYDNEISDEIREKVRDALLHKSVRVGKSRYAEYGNVFVGESKLKDSDFEHDFPAMESDNELIIYCLSDLALIDDNSGVPILVPSPSHFGLNSTASFCAERSFIRVKRYAPFNGKRKHNDLERQVICKGSVISFSNCHYDQNQLKDFQAELSSGVGLYRCEGLGEILVNPSFLIKDRLSFSPVNKIVQTESAVLHPESEYSGILKKWLSQKYAEKEIEQIIYEKVSKWAGNIAEGVCALGSKAPGKSQWNQLRNFAIYSITKDDLRDKLFGEKGLCSSGISKEKWQKEFTYFDKDKKCHLSFQMILKDDIFGGIKKVADEFQDFPSEIVFKKAFHLLGKLVSQRIGEAK